MQTTSEEGRREAPKQQPVDPEQENCAAQPRAFHPGRAKRPALLLSTKALQTYHHIEEKHWLQKRKEEHPHAQGYNDKEGHFIPMIGERLWSRYVVKEILGKGAYGVVLKAFDTHREIDVAVKVVRSGDHFRHLAAQEVKILLALNAVPELRDSVVTLRKVSEWQGHVLIVFELLSYNLYDLIRNTRFNGVSLQLVAKLGWQVLRVLQQLERHSPAVIHCDLKPENILLCESHSSAVKVIDFGSACFETNRPFKYIQSRYYRSPEVILENDYGTAIDRWSLGAMLVELHTGQPLFNGRTEADQLARFQALLGPLPDHMVNAASAKKRGKFFLPGTTQLNSQLPTQTSLQTILGVNSGGPGERRAGQPGHEPAVYKLFLDLTQGLLQYDPKKRLTCTEALQHPFFGSMHPQPNAPGPSAIAFRRSPQPKTDDQQSAPSQRGANANDVA